MKKIIFVLFTAVMLSVLAVGVFAADVFVTVSDGSGRTAVSAEEVSVSDIDGDGHITLDDTLYCVHEKFYNGGAEAGYKSYLGQYGRAIEKLWGISNGGSYGYFINNTSAMSLDNEVKDGDYVCAFAYSDLTTWSDSYSWFTEHHMNAAEGEKIVLKLSSAGYDENFNPLVLPVSGAVITVDGEKTEYITDENGTAIIELGEGKYIVSAVSDAAVLVPPACVITVTGIPVTDAPQTFDAGISAALLTAFVSCLGAIIIVKRKIGYEK